MPQPLARSAIAASSTPRDSFSFPAITAPLAGPSGSLRSRGSGGHTPVAAIVLALLSASGFAHAQTEARRPPAVTSPSDRFARFMSEAALRFDIPASWIKAVMQVESRGVVRALSPKGAMGLMQIMPDTWCGLPVAIRARRRSIRPVRQHSGGRGVSARAA